MPAPINVRPAVSSDFPAVTAIYNHYILHTAVTFDIDTFTPDQRAPWFAQFRDDGPHRLLVAESDGGVIGYAGSHQFRTKKAYDTTVETTVYCAPEALGRRAGRALYGALFEALRDEDLRMAVAGITLPNDASISLHEMFGFMHAGVMHDVGRKFGRYWDVAWYERRLS